MEKYTRPIVKKIQSRLQEPPENIIVIKGPRRVGKTTAIVHALSDRDPRSYMIMALDNPNLYSAAAASEAGSLRINITGANSRTTLVTIWDEARQKAVDWQQAEMQKQGNTQATPFVLVLDEIQKLKNWSSDVKGLWDDDVAKNRSLHVVILGSAPLLLQRGASESLHGRTEHIEMRHWSLREMHDAFGYSLNEYIYYGGYPSTVRFARANDHSRWLSHIINDLITPNLTKDIFELERVEKPALLRQAFEMACSYSGQIVAVNTILAQLKDKGNTTTLSHYFELLNHAGLMSALGKYTAHFVRQRQAAPKLNVLNNVFMAVYSGHTLTQATANTALWGRFVESAIGAHLINEAPSDMKVKYWRESPEEVDFVLQQGQKMCLIEVKSGKLRASSRKGFSAFQKAHPQAQVHTVLVGDKNFSVEEALLTPPENWFEVNTND
jgi:uncharacterized protein